MAFTKPRSKSHRTRFGQIRTQITYPAKSIILNTSINFSYDGRLEVNFYGYVSETGEKFTQASSKRGTNIILIYASGIFGSILLGVRIILATLVYKILCCFLLSSKANRKQIFKIFDTRCYFWNLTIHFLFCLALYFDFTKLRTPYGEWYKTYIPNFVFLYLVVLKFVVHDRTSQN